MSIVKEAMLIMVSSAANNNKFYHVTLDENDVVTKRWGRVGVHGTVAVERSGEKGFDRIVAQKEKKGYTATDVIVVDEEPMHSNNSELSKIAKTALVGKGAVKNDVLEELIDTLVRLNNHDILETSGGMIKVNKSGLITTPLGLIKPASIASAKNILGELEHTSVSSSSFPTLLESYLRLIPQKVGYRRGWEKDFFNNQNTFASQMDFLKQLADSLALQEDRKRVAEETAASGPIETDEDIAAKYEKLFKLKIGLLEDEQEFSRIEKYYEGGKTKYHHTSSLKLKRIFTVSDEEGQERYAAKLKQIGGGKELWHGTGVSNILSIMRKGLIIPPVNGSGIHISGRMFGPGSYFASSSSKSAQYLSYSGSGSNRSFMFLADVAMGKTYLADRYFPYGSDHIQRAGKHDSIYARGGQSGVLNDEMIVWNTDQINIKYLCELGM